MIRVLVAASSAVVRAGLEAILARDPALLVVGSEHAQVTTLSEEVAEHEPHVVLLEGAGFEEPLALVETIEPGSPALVLLADENSAAQAVAWLRSGVRAILPRDAHVTEILAAVGSAAAGLVSMPSAWLMSVLPRAAPARVSARDDGRELTPREREVLQLIAEGFANKQIAVRLGISEHTVKFHVAAVFAKLRASTRAEAVMVGARQGMIVL